MLVLSFDLCFHSRISLCTDQATGLPMGQASSVLSFWVVYNDRDSALFVVGRFHEVELRSGAGLYPSRKLFLFC